MKRLKNQGEKRNTEGKLIKYASQDEIRRSYKKLALKWHPDKNSNNEELREYAEKMFKDINEAYNILSDERKRRIYDSFLTLLLMKWNSQMNKNIR